MRFVTALIAVCPLLLGVAGDSAAAPYADRFMLLVEAHRFEEAADAFFYPPDFTPLRLRREQAAIAGFLASLFKVAGDITTQTKDLPPGANTWWDLGISAGDRPLFPRDTGADNSESVYFRVRCTQEGQGLVTLNFVHLRGNWLLLRFVFSIPRSADNAEGHFDEFTRKVFSGCSACQPSKET